MGRVQHKHTNIKHIWKSQAPTPCRTHENKTSQLTIQSNVVQMENNSRQSDIKVTLEAVHAKKNHRMLKLVVKTDKRHVTFKNVHINYT